MFVYRNLSAHDYTSLIYMFLITERYWNGLLWSVLQDRQISRVEMLYTATMIAACHRHYQLPSSHTSHLSIPFSFWLSLSPSRLCKQSAKYFITSLVNRAETLKTAPRHLRQSKACLVCMCVGPLQLKYLGDTDAMLLLNLVITVVVGSSWVIDRLTLIMFAFHLLLMQPLINLLVFRS